MKLLKNNKEVKPTPQKFGKTILRSLGVMAIMLSSFLFLTSCADSASDIADKTGGLTANQIIENPSAYVGKTVTVSGDVEEIWGPRAFNMDSGASVGELLVVGREPFPNLADANNRAYVINDVATVTGVVRMFVTADVEREIGWDLDPQIEAEFNGKPVLVVQKASFRAGTGANTTTAGNTAMPVGNTALPVGNTAMNNANSNDNLMGADDEITDVLVIAAVPEPNRSTMIGKRVNLNTVKVLSVVGDRTFYVGPNANQRVLVVLDQEATPNTAKEGRYDITPGQTISFNGTVMKMPSVDEADQRFGKLMDKAELNNLKNQQVYIRTDKIDVLGK